MSKTAVEKQEEIFRHIGWENANGVLLSGLTTADLILQYPSHIKERQKRSSLPIVLDLRLRQRQRCLDRLYRTLYSRSGPRKQWRLEAVMERYKS